MTGFLVGLLIVLFFNGLIVPLFSNKEIVMTDYGSFIAKVDSGTVEKVMIKNNQIYFTAIDGNKDIQTYQTGETNDPQLVNRLLNAKSPNEGGKILFTQVVPEENSPILNFLLMWILPGLLFYMFWRFASKNIQSKLGAGGNFMSFGTKGAKIYYYCPLKTCIPSQLAEIDKLGVIFISDKPLL